MRPLTGLPGKRFRLGEAGKASVNHTDLPSILGHVGPSKRDVWPNMRAGAVDYLAKPVQTTDLVVKLKKVLEARGLRDQLAKLRPKLHGMLHSIAFADYGVATKTSDSQDSARASQPFHETPKSAFLRAIDISCFSLISLSNYLCELFDSDAALVTVSISTTRMAAENYGFMAPVKAALDSSLAFLAKSFSGFSQIRFNAVAPGLLKTSASAGIPGYVDAYMYAEQVTLRKQAVRTDEVANAAAFLLSPRSSGINAQQIVIDGGMSVNYFDRELIRRTLRE
jgi:enoyl-[acyl-carrier protein] reductase I